MKKKIYIGVAIVFVIFVALMAYGWIEGSKKSPKGTAGITTSDLDINVIYGRPSKRGRLIFGEEKDKPVLVYGKYWRIGANGATDITFNKNVVFGGKPVNAGTYRMYAIPTSSSWTIVLNSEAGVYFAAGEPDYTRDIIKIEEPTAVAPTETEQLTISFIAEGETVNMDLTWDKVVVRVPIKAQ